MKNTQINVKGKITGSKDVTVLCLALVISAVALYMFAGPAYSRRLSLEKDNVTKKADLTSKRELLKNIQNFNKENADLGVNSKKLAAFVASRNNYKDFFDLVEELAKKSNLEVVTLELKDVPIPPAVAAAAAAAAAAAPADANAAPSTPASYTEKKTFKLNEQGVAFSVRGDFGNILNFAKDLENGIPFVQETLMNISNQKADGTAQLSGDASPEQMQNPILTSKIEFKFNYY